jgi:hypothetical protein
MKAPDCIRKNQQASASEKTAAPATIDNMISSDPFRFVSNNRETTLEGITMSPRPVSASIIAMYVRNDFIVRKCKDGDDMDWNNH